MDIADLEVGYVETEADFNGHKIPFRFRSDVTGRTMLSLKRIGKEADPEPLYAELARLIVAWEVTNGGEPVAITPEAWEDLPAELPMVFVMAIMQAIADPNKRRPLRSGSSQGAASQPIAFPTSTDSSRMPSGQDSPSTSSPDSTMTRGYGRAGALG